MSQEISINELAGRYAIIVERNAKERKLSDSDALQSVFEENKTNIVNNIEGYRTNNDLEADILYNFYHLVGKTLEQRRLGNLLDT
jgi:hypothetical protein